MMTIVVMIFRYKYLAHFTILHLMIMNIIMKITLLLLLLIIIIMMILGAIILHSSSAGQVCCHVEGGQQGENSSS